MNRTKQLLAAGNVALGVALRVSRTPDIVGIVAAAGLDWLFLDLEHGSMTIDTTCQIATSATWAGITPLVRVPPRDYDTAIRVLDNGAAGIVLPHVETAAEAQEAVQNLRFPPTGRRSFGGMTYASDPALPQVEANRRSDEQTLIVVMVESALGLANVGEIAAVEGVDAVFVGANDLSADLGFAGMSGHPAVLDACAKTVAACAGAAWPGFGGVSDQAIVRSQIDQGMRLVLVGSDASFLTSAAASANRALRPTPAGPA